MIKNVISGADVTYETLGCHYDWCLRTPQLNIYQFYVSYVITICSYSFCIAITASLYSKALGTIPQVGKHRSAGDTSFVWPKCFPFLLIGVLDGIANDFGQSVKSSRTNVHSCALSKARLVLLHWLRDCSPMPLTSCHCRHI